MEDGGGDTCNLVGYRLGGPSMWSCFGRMRSRKKLPLYHKLIVHEPHKRSATEQRTFGSRHRHQRHVACCCPPTTALQHLVAEMCHEAVPAYVAAHETGSDPRGHLGVTWGVYLCAGKPPLADIILSRPPELTRCDSVIGLAIPATSGHNQYRGAASGDLYIGISGINRVLLS